MSFDRRASVSLEVLQVKSEKLREQLRRVTVELIDKRSWSSQARRTSSGQRQALVGWLDYHPGASAKVTGIRVAFSRRSGSKNERVPRGAVPVWVMPLSRVVESFDRAPRASTLSSSTKPARAT